MKEEKKERCFALAGTINYEFDLRPNDFSFRSEVSIENNLATMLAVKNIVDAMILKNKKSKDRIQKTELEYMKKTSILMGKLSKDIAGHLYQQQLKSTKQ